MFRELIQRYMQEKLVMLTRAIPGARPTEFEGVAPVWNFETEEEIPAGVYMIRHINFEGRRSPALYVFLDRVGPEKHAPSMRPAPVSERAGGFMVRSLEEFEELLQPSPDADR